MPRQPKGRPTISRGADGWYHTYLTVGTKPNGKLDRKHIRRETAAEVATAIDETLERLKQGTGKLAKIETLEGWLHHWVHVILAGERDSEEISRNTWDDYESICRVHLIPNLGHWRIAGTKRRLEPEHVQKLLTGLVTPKPHGAGLSKTYVRRMRVVLNQALALAHLQGKADRNVMALLPKAKKRKGKKPAKIKGLPYLDACKVVGEALLDPLAARWLLALITGPRQGEVLGIRWHHVELDPPPPDVPHILMVKQVQRFKWQHGCDDPVACVKGRKNAICKTNPCGVKYLHGCEPDCGKIHPRYCPARRADGCWRHRDKNGNAKPCPPPCPPDCAGHASTCKKRKGGGLVEVDLKTHASEEPLAIGSACAELLRIHRERQIQAGLFAADGFVFPGSAPDLPSDPHDDYERWCELVRRSGVAHHRLHAARHTAGSVLSATGSDLPMIRDVLRHADTAVAAGYVDLGMETRQAAVDRVAKALMDGDISMILGARNVA
jgi:integrase